MGSQIIQLYNCKIFGREFILISKAQSTNHNFLCLCIFCLSKMLLSHKDYCILPVLNLHVSTYLAPVSACQI